MCGWLSRAAAWASARSRRRNEGSALVDGGRTFTATCRPRTSSNPRHTTDIPPAPSRSTSRTDRPADSNRAGPSCSCAPTCAIRENIEITPPCISTSGRVRPAVGPKHSPSTARMLAHDRPLSRLIRDALDLRSVTLRSHRPSHWCGSRRRPQKPCSEALFEKVTVRSSPSCPVRRNSGHTPSEDPSWNRYTGGGEHITQRHDYVSLDNNARTLTSDDYSELPLHRRTFRECRSCRRVISDASTCTTPPVRVIPRRRSFLNRSCNCLDGLFRAKRRSYRSTVTRSAAAGAEAQFGEQAQHRRQVLVHHQDHIARGGESKAASIAARYPSARTARSFGRRPRISRSTRAETSPGARPRGSSSS